MNKPILLIVMSEKCGACQGFKKKMLPDLEKEFRNDGRVRLEVLDFPDFGIPTKLEGKEYHPELKNGFVEFFPSMFLVPANIWNNKDTKLKLVPKHKGPNPKIDYSKASVSSWVDETLKKDTLFTNEASASASEKKMDPGASEDGKC